MNDNSIDPSLSNIDGPVASPSKSKTKFYNNIAKWNVQKNKKSDESKKKESNKEQKEKSKDNDVDSERFNLIGLPPHEKKD